MINIVPGEFYTTRLHTTLTAFRNLEEMSDFFMILSCEPFVALTILENRYRGHVFKILTLSGKVGWLSFEVSANFDPWIKKYKPKRMTR